MIYPLRRRSRVWGFRRSGREPWPNGSCKRPGQSIDVFKTSTAGPVFEYGEPLSSPSTAQVRHTRKHPNDHGFNQSSLTITRQPTAGGATVTSAATGTAVVEYTAPATASAAICTYRICDTFGGCTDADVLILAGTDSCTITGTDADGCWSENWRNYTGKLFCDLVSIEGLHWDTGDIKVKASSTIHLGSGHLCLVDTHNTPWCWEWSSDVPPRPARVPDIAEFWLILGDGDFLCGQTSDYATVACWTIGVEQSEYWEDIRQVNRHVPELTVFNPEPIVFNPSDGGSYFAGFQRDGQMTYVSEFTAVDH